MKPRRRVFGLSIILWIIIVTVIGTIITATTVTIIILGSIHSSTQQLSISWNQQIPSNAIIGKTYNWSINTQSSHTDDSGSFAFYLKGGVPLNDTTIMKLTIRSVAGGSVSMTLLPPSHGGFGGVGPVGNIPEGSRMGELAGSWTFNSNAPLTQYNIQVSLSVGHYSDVLISNEISTSTILNH